MIPTVLDLVNFWLIQVENAALCRDWDWNPGGAMIINGKLHRGRHGLGESLAT